MKEFRKGISVTTLFAILFFGLGGYNFIILKNPLDAIFFLLSAIFFIGLGICWILLALIDSNNKS